MAANPVQVGQLQKAGSSAVMAGAGQQLPVVETASSVLAAQAKALVEARYIMAHHHPRDIDTVRQRLLKECHRPSFAEVARYNKPIGKGVTGPSIRFAEAAIRCMQNIVIETISIYDDREKRIVRVSVTDLEANVPYTQDVSITKAVERRKVKDGDVVLRQRTNSYGDPVFLIEATDDEILNQQNALISKAIRTLGLRLIPGDLIDEAMDIVIETQRKRDAEDPDAAKRRLFDGFVTVGVSVEQIKSYLGHSAETISPKELAALRGLFAALRDGETTWREIMDNREPRKADDSSPATPAEHQQQSQSVTAEQQQKPDAPASVKEPEGDADQSGRITFEEVIKGINGAKTLADCDKIKRMIGEVHPAEKQPSLQNILNNKCARLTEKASGQTGSIESSSGVSRRNRTID